MKTTTTYNSTKGKAAANHHRLSLTARLRKALLLLCLMMVGASSAWAQSDPTASIPISSLDGITDKSAYYVLTQDCSAPSTSITGFTGTLDGGFHKITGATHALFATLNGATVKNVILDDVSISGGTDVGAIANSASGDARIYNCGVLATTGSSISGSGNVGSIVGALSGNARVLNCFSYANVGGGSRVAGIVGNNGGTSVDRSTILSGTGSMVFNSIFFGQVESGTNKYPIYGVGKAINNVSNINTYNYFLYDDGVTYANNATGASGIVDKTLLTRFDMYRGILNSHRDLCAMYIYNTQTITDDQRHDIALWLYDPAQRETVPYLQLEPCVVGTRRTIDRAIPSTTEDYKGRKLRDVTCTFVINGSSYTETLPTTDMDTDNWDYTWGKIVLPFANEFSDWTLPASGSNNYDNIITGWEITSITGGTPGSWDGSYDLCNPDCTAKDLYSNSNYVWAQGGNYVVPTGVSAITFTAHIARCVYLADSYVDIAYNGSYTTATNLGTQITGDTYNGKTVYHNLTNAFAQLQDKTNPADQAIVLVGNYHYNQGSNEKIIFPAAANNTSVSAKAVTIMSIDADNNQVPDYAYPQFHNVGSGRTNVPPLRFDFVCSPGIGISSYTRAGYLADVDILHSRGWFEVTETSMIHMTEFEIRPQNFANNNSPLILNGGIYDQILQSTTNEYNGNGGNNDKLSYIRIGGKAYVKKFWPGHKNASANMTINGKPINVSGGQIDMCYLTGDPHNKVINGNMNFYCNGGYIKEYLGAYQEKITGNVTAKIDHALIDNFYGGGSDNAYGTTAQIGGNIDNTINNSYVKFYCAGPKFGTMAAGKTVTTHATGTTFGEYYGAGFGGTALTKVSVSADSPTYGDGDFTFNRDWSNYTNNRLVYNASYGTGVGYDFLFNMYAGGNHRGNCNLYVKYATLSLASTRNVSSTLTNCTLEHDFYGGGCQGMVNGTITNSLTNCTVVGSVFGGGYKASATPIDVYPATQPTYSIFKGTQGFFTEFGTTTPETYSWVAGTDDDVDESAKTISTSVDMTQMGRVTGTITTTIDGGTVGQNVFGGGNESPSGDNTSVTIQGTASIGSDVYGGGNVAPVDGSTQVDLLDGRFGADIFGGGKGAVDGGGNVIASANIGGNTSVTISGGEFAVGYQTSPAPVKPFKEHYNVYGGGNLACQVAGSSHVYATRGMVSKNADGTGHFLENSNPQGIAQAYYHEGQMFFCVFGGGFGKHTGIGGDAWVDFHIASGDGITNIEDTEIEDDLLPLQSYLDVIGGGFNGTIAGDTHVHIGGNAMCRNVYGGGLYAPIGTGGDSGTGRTNVHVTGGNVDNVYGGGVMGDILTATNVDIGLKTALDFDGRNYAPDNGKITILMSVYGGNDVSGHVPEATVCHNGGTVNQNIYGAGNGNYIGYYAPNLCDYDDGENDNYFIVSHDDGVPANSGRTYRDRPHTDRVSIALGGSADHKATVLGQVFGGGNSCTVGLWKAMSPTDKYAGNLNKWRDDPDYFEGGGSVNITLGDHVSIGYANDVLATASDDVKALYLRDGENVSGLYMGCSGVSLATQDKAKTDNFYHHYYDAPTRQYWPGFVVYEDGSNRPLTRDEGIRSFNAYLNNILVWTDNVNLDISGTEDIFLANFVGGGFRGSMKTKTAAKKFAYTLPQQVTVGNLVVGGAYNSNVLYHIFSTTDGHVYTESNGEYEFLSNPDGLVKGTDYDVLEYGATDNVKSIIRFRYDGGILSANGTNITDFVTLNLNNKFAPGSDETKARVFGGCFASGIIHGDAVINYSAGNPDGTQGAYDVYGGGALADIGGNTKVRLLGGVVTNAYGGGLGRLADEANDLAPVAALVGGNTTVQLGNDDGTATAIVRGSVFGANNVNGTPLGHAYVHVLRTTPQPGAADGAYDVAAVYGGGNKAAYLPTSDTECSEVCVENCDNSIEYVYGGGNAAPSPATKVTILGGEFYDIFAGGNGAGAGNPGADVGYYDFTWDEAHKYGAGTSDAYIYSGIIADGVFGGSNTKGNVRTRAEVHIDDLSEETGCRFEIGEIYGAGNEAYMDASAAIDLGCVPKLGVLYGGAKNADIGGGITLNITSGEFGQIFGGNNLGGRVMGNIVVNIDETGCFPVKIGELYTCGNQAAYSVYGYNDDKTPKLSGARQYADPQLNIYSCTSIGKVFGGGLGAAAVVAGNTNVTINQIPGRYASRIDANGDSTPDGDATLLGTIGTVFGGGNEAKVQGETNIYVATSPTKVQHALPYYNGTNGGHTAGEPTDETLYDAGANITGNIYGGGNQADVTGKTNVTVGK